MKNLSCFLSLLLFISNALFAQVSINTDNSAPDPSAGLDVSFSNKGFLPPRMTFEQRNAIQNPTEGLMVFCTNCSADGASVLSLFRNGKWRILSDNCPVPVSPTAGAQNPDVTQIVWNWNTVSIAKGYRWNSVNDFATATDMALATTKIETDLTCNTGYTRYVWAYNDCGYSSPLSLAQSTMFCPCGSFFTINHVAGAVAPVDKTVNYGTVTNIPGEPSKCWITSNLGADHQASVVNDATEASAGWYWQFNRKQGYKHDGTNRTPNTTWITSIDEDLDWQLVNDPCALELGAGWRIPTATEWGNIDASGGWVYWYGPWNSDLKLHAAGYLQMGWGGLDGRGTGGWYCSSTQSNTSDAYLLDFNSSTCLVHGYYGKAYGWAVRCLKE